jgi:hypothetical protein
MEWLLRNDLSEGKEQILKFAYGGKGSLPVVGRWDETKRNAGIGVVERRR